MIVKENKNCKKKKQTTNNLSGMKVFDSNKSKNKVKHLNFTRKFLKRNWLLKVFTPPEMSLIIRYFLPSTLIAN